MLEGSGTYLWCCPSSLEGEGAAPAFMRRDTLTLPRAHSDKECARPQAPYGIFHGNKGLPSDKTTFQPVPTPPATGQAENPPEPLNTPTSDVQGAGKPQRPLVRSRQLVTSHSSP